MEWAMLAVFFGMFVGTSGYRVRRGKPAIDLPGPVARAVLFDAAVIGFLISIAVAAVNPDHPHLYVLAGMAIVAASAIIRNALFIRREARPQTDSGIGSIQQ